MIASQRVQRLWGQLFPSESLQEQFDKKYISRRASLRPDGEGYIRRETPCGAIMVIAKDDYIIDVYSAVRK